MKENIFEVLIYLFENYLVDEIELIPDSEDIKTELVQAGFNNNEVNDAFYWLETLTERITIKPAIPSAFRVFCWQEEKKLDVECRNFLLFLERSAILTTITFEIVIDRVMALENESLSLDELKWTVLMVLLSQSDDEVAYSRMEDIVYNLSPLLLH